MADSVVIVAIPQQDDRVWKISSEKIPHMTLLYLGEMDEGPAFASIENYIEHLVTTTMVRFGASVSKRGTLGKDDADVLFFEKDYLENVAVARQNMLANSEIFSAYLAADQYPEWTPHLTLGYPVAPAKPDTADYPISWVNFDRVAIWFGDSVGPTFDLPPDRSNGLAHHGVKGQKWGVVRNFRELRDAPRETQTLTAKNGDAVTITERKTPPLPAAIGAISPSFRKSMGKSKLLDIAVGGKNVGNVATIHKSKDEVNFAWIGVKPKERGKGYASAVFQAGVEHAAKNGYSKVTLEVPGNAPDARHIYEKFGFKDTGKTQGHKGDIWDGLTVMSYTIPKAAAIQHASIDDELEQAFAQHFGQMGLDEFIFGEDLEHTDAQRTEEVMGSITRLSEDELAHHGVLGMKWGRRKEVVRDSSVTVTSTPGKGITQISGGFNHEPSHDAVKTKTTRQIARVSSVDAVSTKDLQELVNRMNLEQQYSRLTYTPSKFEKGRSVLKELLGAGQQANQAIQFANSPSGSYMKAAMKGDKAAMSEALKPPKKEKKNK